MSEQPIEYQIAHIRQLDQVLDNPAELVPTLPELKLLARLRQLRGMCIVDSDSMTLWASRGPEYCNGKHPK